MVFWHVTYYEQDVKHIYCVKQNNILLTSDWTNKLLGITSLAEKRHILASLPVCTLGTILGQNIGHMKTQKSIDIYLKTYVYLFVERFYFKGKFFFGCHFNSHRSVIDCILVHHDQIMIGP